MSDEARRTVYLRNAQQGSECMRLLYGWAKPWLIAGHQFVIKAGPLTRTLEQNSVQWPYLDAFSKQLQWPVNGKLVTMTDDEWKDVLTAAFNQETVRLAMGLNGGVVMLGLRTSKMSKKRFSEWIDFLKAVAADRGVTVYQDDKELTE